MSTIDPVDVTAPPFYRRLVIAARLIRRKCTIGYGSALNPIDLLSAHPWRVSLFTTYSLSLSFFESVALDALTRGGGRRTMIVADVDGVRAALGEWGARGVGRAYQVEPIGVSDGIFHPKVTVLAGDGECHLLVGSGNLTFGGWGGNLEVLEHLHPSFAPEAFADAADWFEDLATSPRFRHGAQGTFTEVADILRASAQLSRATGAFRLLHGLSGSISEEIAAIADEIGGARRLVVVSPFFDSGAAVDNLCSLLGLQEAYLHAHPAGTVFATHGANWPVASKCAVKAITVDVVDDDRQLHGKLLEISCRNGRILVSGSANATTAALGARGNVEAVVARIERTRRSAWSLTKADPPAVMGSTDPHETEDDWVDVLRATLAGHEVEGRVLTKRITGDVGVFLVEAAGRTWVGDAVVDAEGFFRIQAASLGKAAWRLNRLVIAVEDAAGNRAEGFVLAEDFREVADRVGPLADRFMAFLAGTETPSDVAAIMSWFCANPAHLRTVPAGGGVSEPGKDAPFRPVSVAELLALPPEPPIGAGLVPTASGVKGWSGFMRQLVAAFRAPGAPSPPGSDQDDDDDGDSDGAGQAAPDKAIPRAFEVFEKLLHVLLSGPPEHRQPMLCFELAHYLCSKLDPDASKARGWLRRILASLSNADVLEDRREDVGAAIGALYADGDPAAMRGARKLLFDLGIGVSGKPPSSKGIAGFVGALDAKPDLTSFWEAVQKARTLDEQRASYLAAFAGGRPSDGYPDLAGLVAEWPALERAIVDAKARKRVILTTSEACPKHWMTLPLGELSNLRLYGFGVARNCCNNILVRPAISS